jgi:hypothetical protein
MQNARMSELEKQLAKSSSAPIARSSKAADLSSSDEHKALKDENRVVRLSTKVLCIAFAHDILCHYWTAHGSHGGHATRKRNVRNGNSATQGLQITEQTNKPSYSQRRHVDSGAGKHKCPRGNIVSAGAPRGSRGSFPIESFGNNQGSCQSTPIAKER